MPTRVPDIRNARELLGWEPRYDLREALHHTVAYYVQRGAGPTEPRPSR
jgi:nucleoside-diphosphate-sugar epimerase